jgi:DNA polymerase-3 subunit epsilon
MSASTPAARSLELVRPLAFFDLETTGVDVAVDRIVEIAVLKLLPDGTEETLHTLINPGVPIPASASEVHGICDGDVQGKPTFGQIAERLAQFLKGCDLAGFNVMRFDLPLLKAEFRRAGLAWSEENHKLVDAHIVYQEKERRDLTAAVKFYCGEGHANAHSALADARATRRVLEAQVRRYPELPSSVEGLDTFCKEARPDRFADSGYWFSINNGVLTFNKSQHRKQSLLEVAKSDPGFLNWMISIDVPEDTKDLVRKALSEVG